MKIGDNLPDITVHATGNKNFTLTSLTGQKVVVYFYPKDSTPGCTTEGQNFRDKFQSFSKRNCVILGVSRDNIKSHERFKEKQAFPFDLLSDPDEKLCQAFDVIRPKKLFGKAYLGVERSTFLFDEQGKLIHEWRKVKVKNHVDEVLATLKDNS